MLRACRVRDDVTDTTIDNRSIAVVRTRLPYTDRRSLSQAWFSALHLAESGPVRGLPARRASDARAFSGRSERADSSPNATGRPSATFARGATEAALGRPSDGGAPRAHDVRRTRVSQSAGVTFESARSYPPFRTSLTIGVEGARIKLLLRREGPTLHVIALCAPGNVDLVRRALACADAYLRRNGESVRASVVST